MSDFSKWTREDVENKFKNIFKDAEVITVEKCTSKFIQVEISSMYSPPILSFARLSKLAELFETKRINDPDNFQYTGCETCDYGSKYGFVLTLEPEEDDATV